MLPKSQGTSAQNFQNFLWRLDIYLGLPERIFLLSVSDILLSFFSRTDFCSLKLIATHF